MAGVSLHVITADLNDPHVTVAPALAVRGCGHDEEFGSFISRLRPAAAVNGTFFSKRSLRPIGDIVIGRRLVYFGGMGTALGFTHDGVDAIRLPHSRRVDWWGYQSALAAGPLLVWNGFAKPWPGGEGFGDPHVFARAAPRTAMGITRDNKLLLVTTIAGTSLGALARALRDLGAVYAVNLDGGSSTAMWYQGRTVRSARRRLTNVLCVYVKPDSARPPAPARAAGSGLAAGAEATRDDRLPGARAPRVGRGCPARWEGEQVVRLASDKPLPPDWKVMLCLNRKTVQETRELPADVTVNLDATPRPKHLLWVGVLDGEGKVLGSQQRILRGRMPSD